MRVAIFFIFLSTVFLYGGEHTALKSADSCGVQYSLSQKTAISQQEFIDNAGLHNQVIEAFDLDLGEESYDTDHTQNQFFPLKSTTTTKWYLTLPRFFISKEDFKGVKNLHTYFGYSQPIYIIQRVLRI
jgi:hypothetical protein